MKDRANKILLWIATILVIVAYLFWEVIEEKTGYNIYFVGIALFITILSYIIYRALKYTITFILFWLSIGNLVDELMFDNTALYATELVYLSLVLIVAFFYNKRRRNIAVKP
jgi:hypothetical protein